MPEEVIKLREKKESLFIDKVKEILPEGGNLNLCLTCGAFRRAAPLRAWREWTRASFCVWRPWDWMKKF